MHLYFPFTVFLLNKVQQRLLSLDGPHPVNLHCISCLPFVHAAASLNRERKNIACLMLLACMTRTRGILLALPVKVSALPLIAEAVKCKSDRGGTTVQHFDISLANGTVHCEGL
jgi:hypothetical protein